MNRKIIAIASTLAAIASGPAFSQAYVGIAAGTSHVDIDCSSFDSCDKSGTGVKILGGYEFARDFAAEVTYYSLGKATVRLEGAQADIKGHYWGLGGAYRPQFGNSGWGGVVRVGAAFTDGKIEGPGGSFSHDSTQPYVGLGATYALTKSLKAELDWDRTRVEIEAGGFTDKGTVNNIVIGVNYGF